MTLVRRSPWPSDPFLEMDRLFNRAFSGEAFWPNALAASVSRDFPLDVYGDDERFYVVAELPGVSKESIDLKVENAALTISVETEVGEGESKSTRRRARSVTVGEDIDLERVTAKLENGLLTVTLPKAEERLPRKIAIK